MGNKRQISQILRFLFWIAFCGLIGLVLGSKSIRIDGNVLLEYSLAGGAIGLVIALIFNSKHR